MKVEVKEVVKSENKIFLHRDVNSLAAQRTKEGEAARNLEEIKKIVEKVLLKSKFDYNALIKEGALVLINEYFKRYSPDTPQQVCKLTRFKSDLGIAPEEITRAIAEYKQSIGGLVSAPKITNTGEYKTTILDDMFDKYVSDDDVDLYNDMVKFTELINKFRADKMPYAKWYEAVGVLKNYITFSKDDVKDATIDTRAFVKR